MEIRPMEAGDLDAVADIWNAAIRETTATFTTVEKTREALEAWLAEGGPRLAALKEGELLGFCAAGRFRPGPGYARTWEHTVYVSDAGRGRGVGRALVDALVADLRARGARSLVAGLSGENAGAAAFHRKLGFEEVGRVREAGEKLGRTLDLVLMQRML